MLAVHWLAQPAFLYTTCPREAPPTVGRALPQETLIKKMSQRLANRPILYKHIFNSDFLLPEDSAWVS